MRLQEADVKPMARCIALDMDCAQACQLAIAFMAGGSEHVGAGCAFALKSLPAMCRGVSALRRGMSQDGRARLAATETAVIRAGEPAD